jgi:hypothetical protein
VAAEDVQEPWAIRSALIAVTDLNRSLAFYKDTGLFHEVVRLDAVVILEQKHAGSFVLILREMRSEHRVRHGQQSLGLRSISFNVRSAGELDRIETALRDHGGFTRRWKMTEGPSELLSGRDPDNLPVVFVAYDENKGLGPDYYRKVADMAYSLDV